MLAPVLGISTISIDQVYVSATSPNVGYMKVVKSLFFFASWFIAKCSTTPNIWPYEAQIRRHTTSRYNYRFRLILFF